MKKFDNTGGIASVRVVPLMSQGGSAEKRLADGPPPKQFTLPEEEKVIPSEPNVLIKPNRETGTIFTIPDPTFNFPMPSEPEMSDIEGRSGFMEGQGEKDVMIMGPVIQPQEVYPIDPDPGIMFNPSMGGVPNLLQANLLQPGGNNGIFDLLGKLNNEKPVGSYNI